MKKKKDYTCNYYSEYFEILIMTINSITVLAIINTEHTLAAPPVQSDDMILFGSSFNVIHGSLILIF